VAKPIKATRSEDVFVFLEGPGGAVEDGMKIAYAVKKNGWVTNVERTRFA